MKQTSVLEYFRTDGVAVLKSNVSKNLNWYLSNEKRSKRALPSRRPSNIVVNLVKLDIEDTASALENDIEHSILFYQALKDLTPHQATDGRLWVCLCHTVYRDYVRMRWISHTRKTNIDKAILDHYFVNGIRGLRRDNGISRLWWLGFIAHQVDKRNAKHVLKLINRTADIRLNLIDRPSICSNVRVLRAICKTMDTLSDKDTLFLRENFRLWMIALNRWGGVLVLDTLSNSDLAELIDDEARKAIEEK